MRTSKTPVVTITVLVLIAVATIAQSLHPAILPLLERRPGMLEDGQWWRLVTPLFLHNEGWPEVAFNMTAIAVVGTFVERLYGRERWLLFYFAAGILGEMTGLAWKPLGAGASVAGAGLLGALAMWLIVGPRTASARFGGGFIIAGAIVLVVIRDIHGPPILLGACLAGLTRRNASATG